MEDLNLKAQQDLPDLRRWLGKLCSLVQEMAQEPITLKKTDHFGFMVLSFLSKQIEHTESILILVDKDQGRDAELIIRSMLEGVSQLLWTTNDPQALALRWRQFACIHEWRMMNEQIAVGEIVHKILSKRIKNNLAKYGEQFLTKRMKRHLKEKQPLSSNPYCQNWTGHDYGYILDSAKSLQGELIRRRIYKPISAWQHWNYNALEAAIARDQNTVTFLPPPPTSSATALANAFMCLSKTAELVNNHFKLRFGTRLLTLKENYVAWARNNT